MKELTYVIKDELGIHARPAGQIVKLVSGFVCEVKVGRAEKMVDAKRIMGVMGLAMKQGESLNISFSGTDEDAAFAATEAFLKDNF